MPAYCLLGLPSQADAHLDLFSELTTSLIVVSADGVTERRFAQAFADKAEQGIPVKLLVDAVGSVTLSEETLKIQTESRASSGTSTPISLHLQEVVSHDGRSHQDHQVGYLADCFGYFYAIGETRKRHGGVYGNVTLSRWKIERARYVDLSVSGEARGALRTDIRCGTLGQADSDGVGHFRPACRPGRFQ